MVLKTKEEIADTMNVSSRTITRWVANDQIPFHKIGNGSIRFNLQYVLESTSNSSVLPPVQK